MKTLDKYVLREMLVPFIAGFAIILVFFFGTVVYNNITLIVSRLRQWPDILYLIFLQTQPYVLMALPSGTIFGSSLAVSRLARDSEITVMRISGTSVRRIFLPIFIAALATSMVGYLYQERVIVWSEQQTVKIYNKIMQAPGPTPIQPNIFFRVDNLYFYVGNVFNDGKTMVLSDIMIYEPPGISGFPTLTTAKRAVEKSQVWTLQDGMIYKMGKEGEAVLTGHFKNLKLNLQKPLTEYLASEKQVPRTLTIPELKNKIAELNKSGANPRSAQVEYSFKLALPLGAFVLVFSVTPLAFKFGKGGGFTGALVGIVVFFFYWQVVIYARVIGEAGGINPMLCGWIGVIIFGIIGMVLTSRLEKA